MIEEFFRYRSFGSHMMKALLVFVVSMVVIFGLSSANAALVIPEGHVIDEHGDVVEGHVTKYGQHKLSVDGFVINGGYLFLDVDGSVSRIALVEFHGKSRDGVKQVVVDAVVADAVVDAISRDVADRVSEEVAEEVVERVEREIERLILTYNGRLVDDELSQRLARAAIEAGQVVVMCSGGGCDRWSHELVLRDDGVVDWGYEVQ